MKTLFKHDCEQCIYLGFFMDSDLYYCPQHGLPTLICRSGNSPHQYVSNNVMLQDFMPEFAEARKRAEEKKLI